ncbi:MAG TPA: ATP-binding protein [Magnetospirillum sp.]|nr:ATP-binding protein [Magnetospirillum sp.]
MAIFAVVAAFIGFYWVSLLHETQKNEREGLEAARRRAVFTAQAAAEAIETTLDRFRVTLTTAAVAASQGPVALRLYGDAVSSSADELVYQLFRVDAEGYLAYTSFGVAPREFLADRDYFRQLAEHPSVPLVLSPPTSGHIANKTSLQVAKAVMVDGRFAGVVALAINPERWTLRLSQFEAGNDDVLTLFSADGVYLLRTRDSQQSLGQSVARDRPFLLPGSDPAGTYVQTGTRDGIVRVYAWKRLSTGQVLTSGIALDAALADTRELNRQTMLRGSAATVALALALVVIAYVSRHSDRVSRAIVEKEYLQRVTLSVMAEGLAVVSPSGEIGFHNDSFARIIPYQDDRLRRIEGARSWDLVDANGNPLPPSQYPSVVAARTGQPQDNVTLGIRLADGGVRWLNVNARPLLGRDNAPYAAILTVTDITSQRLAEGALKASEERYRTVIDSLIEGIVVLEPSGAMVATNPAAERILGISREALREPGAIQRSWQAIHADGSEFKVEDYPALATLRTGERCEGVLMGLRRHGGNVTWIEINTAPLREGSSSRVVAVVASFLDITNRKEFEDELSRSNAELEQFAYAVSHDLREPLRMVASYIQLLERRLGAAATDEIKEFVAFAVDGAKRMDRMLVALLEYSRVGRRGLPMEWIDSRHVLDEALLFLSPVVQQTGAQVEVSGDWPMLFASPDEMERLFQNLLGNALKYHADGVTPVIRVSAEQDGQSWIFSFTDNGIGIAPDQTGRLFKVFQRLHSSNQYEGSGVGLALCRRIVQRHEGRIWVESAGPGTGATFRFTLPASQTPPNADAAPASA